MNVNTAKRLKIHVHFDYLTALDTIKTGAFKEVKYKDANDNVRRLILRGDGSVMDVSL